LRFNDGEENVSSVHPAVNQLEYQVDVPLMALTRMLHMLTAFQKPVIETFR